MKTLHTWKGKPLKKEPVMYDPQYSEPCDCGSSTCDECNPGWDHWDWREEEPWDDGEPDYF